MYTSTSAKWKKELNDCVEDILSKNFSCKSKNIQLINEHVFHEIVDRYAFDEKEKLKAVIDAVYIANL